MDLRRLNAPGPIAALAVGTLLGVLMVGPVLGHAGAGAATDRFL